MRSPGTPSASATMVGQSLGARDPDRAEKSVWRACLYNLAFLSAIGLCFVLFARPIVSVFTSDPVVLSQSFNGAGDTFTPTMLNLVIFWLWELPLAWVLAVPLGMGPRGAFLAVAIAFSALALAAGAIFRRGRWKRIMV